MAYRKSRKKKNKSPIQISFLVLFLVFMTVLSVFLYRRYSFSKEHTDLEKYIGVKDNQIAIYLNDVKEDKDKNDKKIYGICEKEACYIPLSYVKSKLNNRFYHAKDINKIIYCLVNEVLTFGETDIHQVGNVPYVLMKEEPYLLINYVKDYTNIRFDQYLDSENKRIYIYTDWDKEIYAYLSSNESAREKGGNKSSIVTNCKKGEEVKILLKMTKWSKVKTSNGFIGYVRNTKLKKENQRIPHSTFIEEKKVRLGLNKKVVLGFHHVLSNYASNRLADLLSNAKNMNVIAPTWYTIRNDEGDIRSIANADYSLYCHNKGLAVWGVFDNFNLGKFDNKKIFSSAITRKKMIEKLLREVEVANLDGLNLDMENLTSEDGEDYIQFVRELSVELSKINKTLSVDTYVPYSFNRHYDLKELNDFCDYVLIMCYDEHYAGSKETGSVSSLSFVKTGLEKTLEQVDREKILAGLPFYTRIWVTDTDGSITSAALDSDTAEKNSIAKGITFAFDEATGQNYGYTINAAGQKIECWLEDSTSLTKKMEIVNQLNIGGVGIWKLTQEREGFFLIVDMNRNIKE